MLSVVLSVVSCMLLANYVEVIILMGVITVVASMHMYKVFTYVEDWSFCLNDMNGLLIFLTISLTFLILVSSGSMCEGFYRCLFLSLLVILISCFSTSNLFIFYVLFESSLVPILLIIIGWGYQPERLQAGMYMILYTVGASMPLLLIILYVSITFGSGIYWLSNLSPLGMANFLYWGFLAFMVKLPVYSVHIWLPKAHVEAPLGGSMILAGALLKLGGYGMYLFNMLVVTSNSNELTVWLMSLSMFGGLFASVLCLNQTDIKAVIAYSSIVHMSVVVMGTLSNTSWGQMCAIITMVAHGWTSSALFLVAYISYTMTSSRAFLYTKGLLTIYPPVSVLWFLGLATNMAVPPTINLVGELAAVSASISVSKYMLFLLWIMMFLSVSYNMFLYCKVNHGAASNYLFPSKVTQSSLLLPMCAHFLPLALLLSLDLFCLCMVSYTLFYKWNSPTYKTGALYKLYL